MIMRNIVNLYSLNKHVYLFFTVKQFFNERMKHSVVDSEWHKRVRVEHERKC